MKVSRFSRRQTAVYVGAKRVFSDLLPIVDNYWLDEGHALCVLGAVAARWRRARYLRLADFVIGTMFMQGMGANPAVSAKHR